MRELCRCSIFASHHKQLFEYDGLRTRIQLSRGRSKIVDLLNKDPLMKKYIIAIMLAAIAGFAPAASASDRGSYVPAVYTGSGENQFELVGKRHKKQHRHHNHRSHARHRSHHSGHHHYRHRHHYHSHYRPYYYRPYSYGYPSYGYPYYSPYY